MAKKSIKKKPVKAGTSKAAAESRRLPFVHEYLKNKRNATVAALAIGISAKSAAVIGCNLLKDIKTQELIKQEDERLSAASGLSVERTLKELSRISYSDPRKLFDKDGKLIPIHLLDDDTAATIAGFQIDEEHTTTTKGKRSTVASLVRSTKPKLWDKNAAIEKAMKHLGMFRVDNEQAKTVIVNSVNYAAMHKPK